MAKYVLIELEGESRMLIVDCETMSVSEADPGDLRGTTVDQGDNLQRVSNARASGSTFIAGVNVAIATDERPEAASFPFTVSLPFNEMADPPRN